MTAERGARSEGALKVDVAPGPQVFQICPGECFGEKIEGERAFQNGSNREATTVDRHAVPDPAFHGKSRSGDLELRGLTTQGERNNAAGFFDQAREHVPRIATNSGDASGRRIDRRFFFQLRIAEAAANIPAYRMRRSLPFLIIIGVVLLALGAGVVLFHYRTRPPARAVYGRPGAEPPHIRGDATAPVQLEEFGDFECLPCSLVWPVLEKLEHDYGKRLVVVFRQHPLKKHRYALDAARAAEAAGLQGRFWEMHDALYRNRNTWVPADYIGPYFNDYATELGLDLDRFKADIQGEEVSRRIAADQDRGESLGIDRTPVIFVNGEQVPVTAHNEKGLAEIIEKALGAGSK